MKWGEFCDYLLPEGPLLSPAVEGEDLPAHPSASAYQAQEVPDVEFRPRLVAHDDTIADRLVNFLRGRLAAQDLLEADISPDVLAATEQVFKTRQYLPRRSDETGVQLLFAEVIQPARMAAELLDPDGGDAYLERPAKLGKTQGDRDLVRCRDGVLVRKAAQEGKAWDAGTFHAPLLLRLTHIDATIQQGEEHAMMVKMGLQMFAGSTRFGILRYGGLFSLVELVSISPGKNVLLQTSPFAYYSSPVPPTPHAYSTPLPAETPRQPLLAIATAMWIATQEDGPEPPPTSVIDSVHGTSVVEAHPGEASTSRKSDDVAETEEESGQRGRKGKAPAKKGKKRKRSASEGPVKMEKTDRRDDGDDEDGQGGGRGGGGDRYFLRSSRKLSSTSASRPTASMAPGRQQSGGAARAGDHGQEVLGADLEPGRTLALLYRVPRISPSKRYLPTLDLTRAAAHPSSSHASLIEVEANEHFPSSSFATVWKGRSGNGRDPIYIKVVGQPDLHLAVQEARVYDSLRTRGRAGLSVGFKGAYVMPDSSFAVLVLKDGGSALGAWQELPEPIKSELYDAVRQLHDCGWLHRDLRPRNIVISNGSARLIDFAFRSNMSVPARVDVRSSPSCARSWSCPSLSSAIYGLSLVIWSAPRSVRYPPVGLLTDDVLTLSRRHDLRALTLSRRHDLRATPLAICLRARVASSARKM